MVYNMREKRYVTRPHTHQFNYTAESLFGMIPYDKAVINSIVP